jgi:hypothetical protein
MGTKGIFKGREGRQSRQKPIKGITNFKKLDGSNKIFGLDHSTTIINFS